MRTINNTIGWKYIWRNSGVGSERYTKDIKDNLGKIKTIKEASYLKIILAADTFWDLYTFPLS